MPGFFVLLLLCACSQGRNTALDADRPTMFTVSGELEDENIDEASGMVWSHRDSDLLWLHNDSGAEPILYAIDKTGKTRARSMLANAQNVDWEDLTGFSMDGVPYLLVADIGDNQAQREFVTLYIVTEPTAGDASEAKLQRIDFRYADGPRDAEAVAVDIDKERVLLLTKRDIPAILYEVPMHAATTDKNDVTIAKRLGPVGSLPQPSDRDIEQAPEIEDWHWQPTAMDIARDGSAIAILTYRAVYVFARTGDEDWTRTLQRTPQPFGLENIREAEAIAFSADSRSLFVTVEKKHAPLLRIDLPGATQP